MAHFDDISKVPVDSFAWDRLTESLVRESCVMPISTVGSCLHVIVPSDAETDFLIDKLRFVTEMQIRFDTADRAQLQDAIDRHYATSEINAEPGSEPLPLSPFSPPDPHAEYPFLDFVGHITHFTTSSISFDLAQKTTWAEISEDDDALAGSSSLPVWVVKGWLDAHFPCNGFNKLHVRCSLPDEYVTAETLQSLVSTIIAVLALPEDVSYHAHIQRHGRAIGMERPLKGFGCYH